MARRKGYGSAADLLALAEDLRDGINSLPAGVGGKIRDLVTSIISQPARRRERITVKPRRRREAKPKPEEAPTPTQE